MSAGTPVTPASFGGTPATLAVMPATFGTTLATFAATLQSDGAWPEWRLSDLVMAELSRYYGLPVFGATNSKLAGAEYASVLLVAALAGTNMIHDVGYLDSGLTGGLESRSAG